MDCKKIRMNLLEYLEQEHDLTDYEVIHTHLSSCSDCQAYKSKLEEVLQFIESDKGIVSDPFMITRIQEACKPSSRVLRYSIVRSVIQSVSIAAMLAVIIFTGTVIGGKYSYKQSVSADYQTELYYLSNIHMDNQVFMNLSEQHTEE